MTYHYHCFDCLYRHGICGGTFKEGSTNCHHHRPKSEEEACPHCGVNVGTYLEMMGGTHNHYDNAGKLIYQRPEVGEG